MSSFNLPNDVERSEKFQDAMNVKNVKVLSLSCPLAFLLLVSVPLLNVDDSSSTKARARLRFTQTAALGEIFRRIKVLPKREPRQHLSTEFIGCHSKTLPKCTNNFSLPSCPERVTVSVPSYSLPGPVQPGKFRLRLQSFYDNGTRKVGCDDLFEVRFDGPTLHVPEISCDEEGSYWAEAHFKKAGTYNTSARFIQTLAFQSRPCFDMTNTSGYILGGHANSKAFRISVLESPTEEHRQTEGSQLQCRAEDFYEGGWIRASENETFLLPTGRSYTVKWSPDFACDWPAFWAPDRLRGIIEGRWIFFAGDSTTQETAAEVVETLSGRLFNPSWNLVPPRGSIRGGLRAFGRIFDVHLGNGTRVSFMWNAHANTQKAAGNGISEMRTSAFRASLHRLFGNVSKSAPDAFILNSGLHDFHRGTIESADRLRQYRDDLDAVMTTWAHIPFRIWRQTNPKRGATECGNEHGNSADVVQLNRIARPLAKQHGFLEANPYQLLRGLYDRGDHHHCMRTEPCDVFALSLFNFFHAKWRGQILPV